MLYIFLLWLPHYNGSHICGAFVHTPTVHPLAYVTSGIQAAQASPL